MVGETGETLPRGTNRLVAAKLRLDEIILSMGGLDSARHDFAGEQLAEALQKGSLPKVETTDTTQISRSEPSTERFNLTEFLSNPKDFSDFVGYLSHADVARIVGVVRSLPRVKLKIQVVGANGSVNNYKFGGMLNRTAFKRGIDGPIAFYQSRVEKIRRGANDKSRDGDGYDSDLYFNISTPGVPKPMPKRALKPDDPMSKEMVDFITEAQAKKIERKLKASWVTRLTRVIKGIMARHPVQIRPGEQSLADAFRVEATGLEEERADLLRKEPQERKAIVMGNPEIPQEEDKYPELTVQKMDVAELALKVLGVIPFENVEEIKSIIKSGEEAPKVSYAD